MSGNTHTHNASAIANSSIWESLKFLTPTLALTYSHLYRVAHISIPWQECRPIDKQITTISKNKPRAMLCDSRSVCAWLVYSFWFFAYAYIISTLSESILLVFSLYYTLYSILHYLETRHYLECGHSFETNLPVFFLFASKTTLVVLCCNLQDSH